MPTVHVQNEDYMKLMKIQHEMEIKKQRFVSMAEVVHEVMKK